MRVIVELKNVSKTYGEHSIIKQLNLKIRQGEIVGLLGLNGAGKTTTIKMMLGLIKRNSGEIKYFNKSFDAYKCDILPKIGSAIEHPGFYEHLTVYENMRLITNVVGLHKPNYIDELLNTVSLIHLKYEKVLSLTQPEQQKLAIARALLNNPAILLLDEPFSGLDMKSINEIRSLLMRLAKERRTSILISSHILSEIEKLSDRIVVLHHGRVIKEFDRDYLKTNKVQRTVIRVDKRQLFLERLKRAGYKDAFEREDYLYLTTSVSLEKLSRKVDVNGIHIMEVYPTNLTLEDYFFELVERNG